MNEHTPQLSVWPMLVGLALTLLAIGVLATWIIAVVGVVLLLFALWMWVDENRVTGHAHSVEVHSEELPHE